MCSEDVESGLTATRGARGGEGERDLEEAERLLWSTVEPELEKKRGVSHVAGAVADRRFSFFSPACTRARPWPRGLVARRTSCEVDGRLSGVVLRSAYRDEVGSGGGGVDEGPDPFEFGVVARDPMEDLRELLRGMPKRFCNLVRVDVGGLEAEDDNDPCGVDSGGGEWY